MNIGRYTGIGSTSLLLIFSAPCLAVIALLSLYYASSEKALTDKFMTSVESYYSADCLAVETASELLCAVNAGKEPDKINGIIINKDELGTYSFYCFIERERYIAVRLEKVENGLKILSWHEVNIKNWSPYENLTVWDGENLSP